MTDKRKDEILTAWDKLPHGNHSPRDVESWLINDMAPVINKLRNKNALGFDIPQTKQDLSPPVPDDVAEAVAWVIKMLAGNDTDRERILTSRYLSDILCTASTPSANCPDCGSEMMEVCSGLEKISREGCTPSADVQRLTDTRNKLTTEITELVLDNEALRKALEKIIKYCRSRTVGIDYLNVVNEAEEALNQPPTGGK